MNTELRTIHSETFVFRLVGDDGDFMCDFEDALEALHDAGPGAILRGYTMEQYLDIVRDGLGMPS